MYSCTVYLGRSGELGVRRSRSRSRAVGSRWGPAYCTRVQLYAGRCSIDTRNCTLPVRGIAHPWALTRPYGHGRTYRAIDQAHHAADSHSKPITTYATHIDGAVATPGRRSLAQQTAPAAFTARQRRWRRPTTACTGHRPGRTRRSLCPSGSTRTVPLPSKSCAPPAPPLVP